MTIDVPHRSPPRRTLRTTGPLVAAWGISVWLVLQLQYLPSDSLHSICGPWGCGPPLSVLVACHGFWLVILGPPLLAVCCLWNPRRQFTVGVGLAVLGLLTLAGFGVWEATHWLQDVTDFQRQYFLHRWMFVVGTLVDVPIVEVTLCGTALAITGWWRIREAKHRSRTDSAAEPGHTGTDSSVGSVEKTPVEEREVAEPAASREERQTS